MKDDKSNINHLVKKYLSYWVDSNIDGLMSMYAKNIKYQDIPSGEVVEYDELHQFILDTFARLQDYRFKLNQSTVIEGNTAFLYWTQSFVSADTGRNVKVNGVELIVFEGELIKSVHEFYEFQATGSILKPASSTGSNFEKMTKLGLSKEMTKQISFELSEYLKSSHPYLLPDLTLATVADKLGYRVRAKHVIMACYNSIIPYICPEVPDQQVEAINYSTKSPLVYTNILLRNWRAFAELNCNTVTIPRADMLQDYYLDFPVSMGNYTFSENPDQPIIVHGTYVPTTPNEGFTAKEQYKLGRQRLYQHTFEEFEASIVDSMSGMLKGGDFDAERDIAAITVNRWPHGYAYEYLDFKDDKDFNSTNGPHIAGRAQIGRISIANSDSSSLAYVNGAIDAAVRAVNEQVKL